MSLRKRLRQLIAAPGLTVMPGAYDALSARIIERAGFDAILAGGYAANGAMLAQADMGQSNMRDYAEHYARISSSRPRSTRGATTISSSARAPTPPASRASTPRSRAASSSWRRAPTWRSRRACTPSWI